MWRFRSEVIFAVALAFAAKTLIHPDAPSVCGLILFLSAHYIDRYFSDERAEVRAEARLKAFETDFREDIRVLKADLGRISMSVGIRGVK